MKISVLKETTPLETRVAATPESISRFMRKFSDIEFLIEKGAGQNANYSDESFTAVGAKIVSRDKALKADIILGINAPEGGDVKGMSKEALVVGNLNPFANGSLFEAMAKAGVNALACERIPRISRAQAMDTLSSQAGIAGYRAVIEAVRYYDRFCPVMMTAAGSSKPAKVVILGVGVAGLQAIATARRLGASVSAFDVRPEVAEQVLSLGAKFLDLGLEESGAGEGGYAKELSEEGKQKQQQALQEVLKTADIIITTAQIPGRPAPVLVTEDAIKGMAAGTVVVDMAAGGYNASNGLSGGNCPLSKVDEVVDINGVKIINVNNFATLMPKDASNFFAKNLTNLLELVLKKEESGTSMHLDRTDEIIDKALSVYAGSVQ